MRIALIQMPPLNSDRPSIGLALVAQAARNVGHTVDILHENLWCADRLGPQLYQDLCGAPNDSLLTDIAFVRAIEPHLDIDPLLEILSRRLGGNCDIGGMRTILERVQDPLSKFLESATLRVIREGYELIGLTAVFSLFPTIAAVVKLREFGYKGNIVLGGSHCEGPMGEALLALAPGIDHVVRGYAENTFPELLNRIAAKESVSGLAGVVTRVGERVTSGPPPKMTPMDELPRIHYADWFVERQSLGLGKPDTAWIPVETARGCWYGQVQQCTFCGLNGEQIAFKSKSPQRAYEEFCAVADAGARLAYSTDPIIDRSYFSSLLPRLAESHLQLSIFYEVKSNIKDADVELLAKAGVRAIQPGIESLNGNILRIMRKGVRTHQNVQVLISAARHGVGVGWNLLYGFPGESADDYDSMEKLIPLLYHLEPPGVQDGSGGWVRLDRFSPMFQAPSRFGLTNVRPHPIFESLWRHLSPTARAEDLFNASYYFDYDYSDNRRPQDYVGGVMDQLKKWHNAYPGAFLVGAKSGEKLWVLDTRDREGVRRLQFCGIEEWLLSACKSAPSLRRIRDESGAAGYTVEDVEDALAKLSDLGLVVPLDNRFVCLIVRLDEFIPPTLPAALFWSGLEVVARNRGARKQVGSRQASPAAVRE